MSQAPDPPQGAAPPEDRPGQGVQFYTVFCLAALGVILVALWQRGLGAWALVPVLVGLLAVGTRWTTGPLVLLLSLAVVLHLQRWYVRPLTWREALRVSDLVLDAAALGFVLGHYRLRSLVAHVFPPDPRRFRPRARARARPAEQRRSPRLVSRQEVGNLVLVLPGWAVLAQVVWRLLPLEWANPGLPIPLWRAMWLAWILGVGSFVVAGLVGYRNRGRMTPAEASLFLQDVTWRETRGEQRRLGRWLAWARLRGQRRKETP